MVAGIMLSAGAPAQASAAGFVTVPSPNVAGADFNQLDATATVSATNAWAVGFARASDGLSFRALIEHWNGSSWSIVTAAARPAGDDTRLHAVAAASATDVWAVGSETGTTEHSLIERWNGTAWSAVPGPANEPAGGELVGLGVLSSTDIWAVGDSNDGSGFATLIEHWNGTAWSVVPNPAVVATGHDFLSAVAGAASGNVWAVGRTGRHSVPILEHWNGSTWSRVTQPVSGFDSALRGLAVVTATDIWAVGEQGLSQTVTEHWDGTAWSLVPSPNPPGTDTQPTLTGVAAFGSSDVWTVGLAMTSGSLEQTLAAHWNGTAWQIVASPNPAPNQNVFNGAAGSGAGQPLWAVGSATGRTPTTATLIANTTA